MGVSSALEKRALVLGALIFHPKQTREKGGKCQGNLCHFRHIPATVARHRGALILDYCETKEVERRRKSSFLINGKTWLDSAGDEPATSPLSWADQKVSKIKKQVPLTGIEPVISA